MNKNYSTLYESAQFVKGVGPKKILLLNKLQIRTVKDLLYYFPRRYEDRSNFRPIAKAAAGEYQTVRGKVRALGIFSTRRRMRVFQLAVGDATGVIYATWFNQPYLKNVFRRGDEVILYGKVEFYRRLQLNNPEYEIIREDPGGEEGDETIHTGRIVPVYPLIASLRQRYLRAVIKHGVDNYAGLLPEFLPEQLLQSHKLIGLSEAVRNMHFPPNNEAVHTARHRLVFDEFFLLECALALKRRDIKENQSGIAHAVSPDFRDKFLKSLPYVLTKSQQKVITEIEQDMASPKPMNRLLQGDVGSGKTVVGVWAMVIAVHNGFQAVFMAPTEILAVQHDQTVSAMLAPLGIKTILITSALKKAQKENALRAAAEQEADVIIGTHALLQEEVKFKKPGLVIVDEQHKFGVLQRIALQKKGPRPDVLVMSATPIPRTLAITVFGDLDVSTLRELPPGRTPVKTYWISEKKRPGLYDFLRKKINEGRQIYVVYPVIEKSKSQDLKAAVKMFEHFQKDIFPDLRIGLVHGRMKDDDRAQVMAAFKSGALDLLVATTVIEVGIDVANASIMLVEHAERFGLSQLHQLRGRVGRGSRQSYCILLSEAQTDDGRKRLAAMTKTNDGFKIAEYDLLIRGPGEFFGTRQHGLPELKLGNIISDAELLKIARAAAFDYVEQNPRFSGDQGQLISGLLRENFSGNKELLLAR